MTTIRLQLGSSIYEYGSTARAIHDGRRRLIAVRRVGGGAPTAAAAAAVLLELLLVPELHAWIRQ